MNDNRLYSIILGPLMTEKSERVANKHRQIVFRVAQDATKIELARAVEKLFSVKVESVKTAKVRGKHKQFRQSKGKRSDWKKAYVCLAEGQDINIANFQ